jgi:uncharacterized membrane protein
VSRLLVSWLLGLVLVLAATSGYAQRTGSSFGGGSFRGSGSSSSSFRGSGSSHSYSFPSSSHSYGSYSSGNVAPILVGVVLVIALVLIMKSRMGASAGGAVSWGEMDVSVLSLAIDWRARRPLQAELDRIAKSGDTATPDGLVRMLGDTVVALRRAEVAWLYGGAKNAQPMSAQAAEEMFRQSVADARSRYRDELTRNQEGQQSSQVAPEMRARAEEGQGLVVVTLCVAARRELLDVPTGTDAGLYRGALEGMAALAADDLVALEVVWSPATENDRMSSAELQTLYPELRKLDEASIAGRVFCAYCRGPFPAELLKCPHCGAPLEQQASS